MLLYFGFCDWNSKSQSKATKTVETERLPRGLKLKLKPSFKTSIITD